MMIYSNIAHNKIGSQPFFLQKDFDHVWQIFFFPILKFQGEDYEADSRNRLEINFTYRQDKYRSGFMSKLWFLSKICLPGVPVLTTRPFCHPSQSVDIRQIHAIEEKQIQCLAFEESPTFST